jgi:molecular chaperone GrpE (heat shock protein)
MTEKKKKPTKQDEELKALLQRTQASFENYRKQSDKRIEDIKEMAARDIITQIIPVLDNFDLALRNTKQHQDFIKGVELIYSQLSKLLEDNNVKKITATGKFDPHFHEALLKVPSDQPADAIVEEFQKGYTLHGQVIRHAKVKISSGAKPPTEE